MIDHDLLQAAIALFEGDEYAARRWLEQPQRAFGGKRPIDVEVSEALRAIGQIEHGCVL